MTLDDAYQIARRAHEGQVDKAGKPYILHPLAVARSLAEHGEQAQIAGMLHDVIEDDQQDGHRSSQRGGSVSSRIASALR